jgi:hypothetical protein
MITDHKIEIGDVDYSKLSQVLRFTTACNIATIQMVEDIAGRTDMTMEEIAEEMRKLFETALHMAYHRGGQRRKYD